MCACTYTRCIEQFQTVTLACLTKIAAIESTGDDARRFLVIPKQITMFTETIKALATTINVAAVDSTASEREFLQTLGLFLATFLEKHGALLQIA